MKNYPPIGTGYPQQPPNNQPPPFGAGYPQQPANNQPPFGAGNPQQPQNPNYQQTTFGFVSAPGFYANTSMPSMPMPPFGGGFAPAPYYPVAQPAPQAAPTMTPSLQNVSQTAAYPNNGYQAPNLMYPNPVPGFGQGYPQISSNYQQLNTQTNMHSQPARPLPFGKERGKVIASNRPPFFYFTQPSISAIFCRNLNVLFRGQKSTGTESIFATFPATLFIRFL
jgi:hypothetical protein